MDTLTDKQLIAELSRDLIAVAAPQEMPLFRANSEAYFRDPQKALQPAAGKDEKLSFGSGEIATFLTPFAIAVTTEVVTFLAEEVKTAFKGEGSDVVQSAVKALFKKFRPKEKEQIKAKVPPLTPEQLARVKKLALEKAHQLKLSERNAALLADSILGSLAVE